MTRSKAAAALLLLMSAAGCTVAPPADLLQDPSRSVAPLTSERQVNRRLAVAVSASYDGRAFEVVAPARGDEASVTSDARAAFVSMGDPPPSEPRPYSWDRPPLPLGTDAAFQERLASVLEWGLCGGAEVASVLPGDVRLDDLPQDRALAADARRVRLGEAADRVRAHLVVHVDVVENRISWVRRDGLWWWGTMASFWIGGMLPVVLVADEVYEARIEVAVTVVHARSGEVVLRRTYRGEEARSLNDPQRGWTVSGFLWLHPYTISGEDYLQAYDSLKLHALRRLEENMLRGLGEDLPRALEVEEVRELLKMGREDRARTYAIVAGANGRAEGTGAEAHHVRFAVGDARAVRDALLASGTVATPDHVRALTDDLALRAGVLDAIADLGPDVLGYDRLIVYLSGVGTTTTDAEGRPAPALLLADGPLPLAQIAQACRGALAERGRVVFVVDASFDGAAGDAQGARTLPGAAPCDRDRYLEELGDSTLNWRVLAACSPGQAAVELDATVREEEHGILTYFLLSALHGAADADADGVVTTQEAHDYLLREVPQAAQALRGVDQTPFLRGAAAAVPLAVVVRSS